MLCGLDIDSINFAALPPHFTPAYATTIPFASFVPHYDLYTAQFKEVISYLVASGVYHTNSTHSWIRTTLPLQHPYWSSKFHTDKWAEKLGPHVLSGSLSNPVSGMKATGIPNTVPLMIELKGLSSDVQLLRNTVADMAPTVATQVVDQLKNQNYLVTNEVNNIELMRGMLHEVLGQYHTPAVALPVTVAAVPPALPDIYTYASDPVRYMGRFRTKYRVGQEGGGYNIPSMNTRQAFDLWCDGNPAECIPPLKHLKAPDISKSRRGVYSKIVATMSAIHGNIPDINKLYGTLCIYTYTYVIYDLL